MAKDAPFYLYDQFSVMQSLYLGVFLVIIIFLVVLNHYESTPKKVQKKYIRTNKVIQLQLQGNTLLENAHLIYKNFKVTIIKTTFTPNFSNQLSNRIV